jgi:hypothetical protein
MTLHPPLQLANREEHQLAAEHDLEFRLHVPLEVVEASRATRPLQRSSSCSLAMRNRAARAAAAR